MERGAFFCSYIQKLSAVFLSLNYQNHHSVTSFNWKNDQWDAAHLFCFYIQKLSPVFLCFTLRNWRSVISFNWKNDQWNAAHLFCFYIQKSNIQHSHQNSLFTFDEPLLDAESVLEHVLDTNLTSFLRRF